MRRATRSDLGISLGVGFLIGAGPLSSPNLGLSVLLGAASGGLLLLWRLNYTPLPRADAPKRWEVPAIYWPLLALYAAAAWPTLAWMYREWTGSVWHNTHGMLMPVLMVLLGDDTGEGTDYDFEYTVQGPIDLELLGIKHGSPDDSAGENP